MWTIFINWNSYFLVILNHFYYSFFLLLKNYSLYSSVISTQSKINCFIYYILDYRSINLGLSMVYMGRELECEGTMVSTSDCCGHRLGKRFNPTRGDHTTATPCGFGYRHDSSTHRFHWHANISWNWFILKVCDNFH